MPCPFSPTSTDLQRYYRRDVITNALAAGGLAALAACVETESEPDVSRGVADLSEVPERQFAWNDYLSRDPHGNTIFPYHQLILLLDYVGDYPPSATNRDQIEGAFATIDRAFQRGNGGKDPYLPEGGHTPGLLYTMGYSSAYFDGFDEDLPPGTGLQPPEDLLSSLDESDTKADPFDAVMVLTSDHAEVLLATELALSGKLDTLNGLDVQGTFADVFEIADRRSGVIGPGVPRHELGREDIPSRSPLAMGFISGFADNQASEDAVAIDDGPFVDGTTQQVSQLRLDLDAWYELKLDERVDRMFSPEHTTDDLGEVGQFLASESGLTKAMHEIAEEHATNEGIVGHTQKLAAARNDEFDPVILRRSEAVSTGDPNPGFNFTSVQRRIEHFLDTRRAMNGEHIETDIPSENDGILDFISVTTRGTYLVPPRSLIALPKPRPS